MPPHSSTRTRNVAANLDINVIHGVPVPLVRLPFLYLSLPEMPLIAIEPPFGNIAPGIVQYTTDVLFRDLWLRPDLAPRDRSLVTVSALIANGQVAQIPYHLNRAMDNGLTQTQAAEIVMHLAFYVGWPNAFSALPVVKDVFEKRPH